MTEWLLDDTQWQTPQQDGKEMFLKQCGLLLFAHYRWQLGLYLRRLEDGCPGTVPAAVFETLERIGAAVPGAHVSDLWLHEAVDPALVDFSAMRSRPLREKTAEYVQRLKALDDELLWSFVPPATAQDRPPDALVCESFAYRRIGKVRFIGIDAWRTNEEWDALWARSDAFFTTLDAMTPRYGAGISEPCAMMHHNGREVDSENHYLVGRFFRADTPVPEGFDFYDVPTERAAYAIFTCEGFDGDRWAAYYRTRDRGPPRRGAHPLPAALLARGSLHRRHTAQGTFSNGISIFRKRIAIDGDAKENSIFKARLHLLIRNSNLYKNLRIIRF